ncbi:hypothetical protein [Hydrogenophaga sp.]|uniref:hypothetical protein n=1 Tax=Hydrogenophaga sp. TaxID=1904254 RepID=UPI002735A117|nr:hypothetical protein [Hydrogenophaga sp.]MDP3474672.1 hypothetical protein [Hydrogenophaga sp.]
MRYADELEAVLEAEQGLRLQIARRIAQESGVATPTQQHVEAADAAIEAWGDEAEEEQDLHAFRPLTPLQTLLVDHRALCDRILDIRDRRLS